MKKYLFIALILIFGLTAIGTTYGRNYQHSKPKPAPAPAPRHSSARNHSMPPAQVKTQQVLRKTNDILRQAQNNAKRGRMRQGLGKAVAHQRRAHDLYTEGWYERAISHSLEARKLAGQLIRRNRGKFSDNDIYADTKDVYYYSNNSTNDLESEIKIRLIDDNSALKFIFDMEF